MKSLPNGNRISIDLAEPYEKALAAVLALPPSDKGKADHSAGPEEVTEAFRRLYQSANGFQVRTVLGPITIGPAVAPWLTEAPLSVGTREEFLEFVTDLYAGFRAGFNKPMGPGRRSRLRRHIPVHITAHNLPLHDALRRFVLKKVGPLRRFANDGLTAEIVLRRDGSVADCFSAAARISLPGRDIHAQAEAANTHEAIRQLVSKLGRLARKRKTRRSRTFLHARNRRTSTFFNNGS